MDTQQAELIERYQETKLKNVAEPQSDDDDLDELLESIENDEISSYREQRLAQLKKEFGKIDRAAETLGDELGSVIFTDDEKELMGIVTRADISVVHFYQPTFPKCKVMNEKLAIVAEKHVLVTVLAVQAEKTPFLVSKLKIKVLPFVVVYKKGQEITRILGFEGIGPDPGAITVEALEQRLYQCGAINRKTINFASVRGPKAKTEDDSEDDWY